jgi:hypothetical protein
MTFLLDFIPHLLAFLGLVALILPWLVWRDTLKTDRRDRSQTVLRERYSIK